MCQRKEGILAIARASGGVRSAARAGNVLAGMPSALSAVPRPAPRGNASRAGLGTRANQAFLNKSKRLSTSTRNLGRLPSSATSPSTHSTASVPTAATIRPAERAAVACAPARDHQASSRHRSPAQQGCAGQARRWSDHGASPDLAEDAPGDRDRAAGKLRLAPSPGRARTHSRVMLRSSSCAVRASRISRSMSLSPGGEEGVGRRNLFQFCLDVRQLRLQLGGFGGGPITQRAWWPQQCRETTAPAGRLQVFRHRSPEPLES